MKDIIGYWVTYQGEVFDNFKNHYEPIERNPERFDITKDKISNGKYEGDLIDLALKKETCEFHTLSGWK